MADKDTGYRRISLRCKRLLAVCTVIGFIQLALTTPVALSSLGGLVAQDQWFGSSSSGGRSVQDDVICMFASAVTAYALYFMLLGHSGMQLHVAIVVGVALLGAASGYMMFCMRQRLPGGGLNVEYLIDGGMVACFQLFIGGGIALKCIMIRGKPGESRHLICDHCGYDLTSNVTGRCPECGAFVNLEEIPNEK